MQRSGCVHFRCFHPDKPQSLCLIAKGSYRFIMATGAEHVAQLKPTEPTHVNSNLSPVMEQREGIA